MPQLVGAIDIGTSRVKAVVFDTEFRIKAGREYVVKPYTRQHLVVEHDPHKLFSAFEAAVEWLRSQSVCCAGVSVFRGSVLAWSGPRKPLTPVVTWMDRRVLFWKPPLAARIGRLAPILRKALLPGSPALTLRLLLEEHGLLGELKRGRLYAWTLDAYIAHSISGRFLADPSSAVLTGLVNPASLKPLRIIEALLGLHGLVYPDIIWHDEPLASFKSLNIGPIIADQQASMIGLGCLRRGCMKITMGTGVFVDAVTEKPKTLLGEDLVTVIGLHTRSRTVYGVEGFAAGVGLVVDLLLEIGVVDGYDALDEALDRPPETVYSVPVLGGLRTPYVPEAGLLLAVIGYPASRRDIVSSIVHGIAATASTIASRVSEAAGKPDTVRVGGGLSRSRRLVEILASHLSKPVEKARDHYDTARGAAMLAALAHGVIGVRDLLSWNPEVEVVKPTTSRMLDVKRWYRFLKTASSLAYKAWLQLVG